MASACIGHQLHLATLAGLDAANYSLSAVTASHTIAARALSVNYTGVDKVYNQSATATVTTSDDRISGDTLTITRTAAYSDGNVARDTLGNVVSKAITVSSVSVDNTNYSVAATGAATASLREPEVIIPRSATVIESNDHVVFFLPNKRLVRDVEKLFRVSATFF